MNSGQHFLTPEVYFVISAETSNKGSSNLNHQRWWLLPMNVYHYFTLRWCHTGLVVVHRCLCRIGLLIIPLLWNIACCFLVPWKLILQEKSFISDASWIFQGLHLRYMVSSSIGTYPSIPGRQPMATASLKLWLKQKSFIYVAMQLAGIVWKSNSDYKILSVPKYCDTLHT